MSEAMISPSFIGRYIANEVAHLMPVGDRELARAQSFFARILRAERITRGRNALIISSLAETANLMPFERALADLGIVICAAESNPWDGMRTESIIRRYDVALVAPLSGIALNAIATAGFDPLILLKGKIVWAKPDAFTMLDGAPDIDLRRWIDIGPATAIESRYGNILVDGREWLIESEAGKAYITSRLDRAHRFDRLEIDMHLTLDHRPCPTGLNGPQISI